METITPQEIGRALAECSRLQSWEPLAGLLPSDDDMPDSFERFSEWDWTDHIEPESEY